MPHLTLDVAHEESETVEAAIADLTRGTDVTATVIDPAGPAGGWPVVTFTGTRDGLVRLAVRYEGIEGQIVDLLLGNRSSRSSGSAIDAARDLLDWIKD